MTNENLAPKTFKLAAVTYLDFKLGFISGV